VTVDKSRHGSYSAQIGSGGNSINARGKMANIRLTRNDDGFHGGQPGEKSKLIDYEPKLDRCLARKRVPGTVPFLLPELLF